MKRLLLIGLCLPAFAVFAGDPPAASSEPESTEAATRVAAADLETCPRDTGSRIVEARNERAKRMARKTGQAAQLQCAGPGISYGSDDLATTPQREPVESLKLLDTRIR